MNTKNIILLTATVAATCGTLGGELQATKIAATNVGVTVTTASKQGKPFGIPPSLIHRMTVAHNAARNKLLGISIDTEELFALDDAGGRFNFLYTANGFVRVNEKTKWRKL